jgi:ectoine hydroxylase-related dioxygenase (phytanoyl-CoA dioxygenase family)
MSKALFDQQGFYLAKGFLSFRELQSLRDVVQEFHQQWQADNAEFYASRAINSSKLTGRQYLDDQHLLSLFKFLGSNAMMAHVNEVFAGSAMFMNTQLFFNPVNPEQRNYWHRDPQYHLTLEQQQEVLHGPDVVHFRIALRDEPGIEVVPGSHRKWDSAEELDVRLERNGRSNSDDLSSSKRIELKAGDLAVFSASMLHRGIYGGQRLALDVLFCEPVQDLADYVDIETLPSDSTMLLLQDSSAFERAKGLRTQ